MRLRSNLEVKMICARCSGDLVLNEADVRLPCAFIMTIAIKVIPCDTCISEEVAPARQLAKAIKQLTEGEGT